MTKQELYSSMAEKLQKDVRNEIIKFNNILITVFTSLSSLLVFLPFNVKFEQLNKYAYLVTLSLSILTLIISLTIHYFYIQHKSTTLNNLGKFFKTHDVNMEPHIELPNTFGMQYIYWVRRIQIFVIIGTFISGGLLAYFTL